jgi:hypothetical protein
MRRPALALDNRLQPHELAEVRFELERAAFACLRNGDAGEEKEKGDTHSAALLCASVLSKTLVQTRW